MNKVLKVIFTFVTEASSSYAMAAGNFGGISTDNSSNASNQDMMLPLQWHVDRWNLRARQIYLESLKLAAMKDVRWYKSWVSKISQPTAKTKSSLEKLVLEDGLISVFGFNDFLHHFKMVSCTPEERQEWARKIPAQAILRKREDYEKIVAEPKIVCMSGHKGNHSGTYGTNQSKEYYMIDDNPVVKPDLVMDINKKATWRYFPDNWASLVEIEHAKFLYFSETTIPEILRVLKPGGRLVMHRDSFMSRVSNPYPRTDGREGIFIGPFGRYAGVCPISGDYFYGIGSTQKAEMQKLLEEAAWDVMYQSFMSSGLFRSVTEEMSPTWEGEKPVIVMTKS